MASVTRKAWPLGLMALTLAIGTWTSRPVAAQQGGAPQAPSRAYNAGPVDPPPVPDDGRGTSAFSELQKLDRSAQRQLEELYEKALATVEGLDQQLSDETEQHFRKVEKIRTELARARKLRRDLEVRLGRISAPADPASPAMTSSATPPTLSDLAAYLSANLTGRPAVAPQVPTFTAVPLQLVSPFGAAPQYVAPPPPAAPPSQPVPMAPQQPVIILQLAPANGAANAPSANVPAMFRPQSGSAVAPAIYLHIVTPTTTEGPPDPPFAPAAPAPAAPDAAPAPPSTSPPKS